MRKVYTGHTSHNILSRYLVRYNWDMNMEAPVPEIERVAIAALRLTLDESAEGEIFTGMTHYVAYEKIEEKYPELGIQITDPRLEDGFLTNKDRFISRDEAFEMAKSTSQLKKGLEDAETLEATDFIRDLI